MNSKSASTRKTLNLLGCIVCWFAVIGQLVLIIMNRQAGILETLIRFFSYFTILTNTLVALYFTSQLLLLKPLNFLRNHLALMALTAYILIVGLVYQFVLRSIWQPSGFQMLIDELLHTFIPVYVLLYWFLYINPSQIKPKKLAIWLLYPLVYFAFVMLRGYVSNFYPYPFINVSQIGYSKSFSNFMLLSGVALLLMGGLYVLSKVLKKD